MRKKRLQTGTISKIGKRGIFYGRWLVNKLDKDGNVVRKFTGGRIGFASEMTRTEAKRKLIDMIQRSEQQHDEMIALHIRSKSESKSSPVAAISHLSRGAVCELLTAAELMKRGFDVYRNMNPTGSCDLVIWSRTTALRVEVKRGMIRNGEPVCGVKRNGQFDILALVDDSLQVHFFDGFLQPAFLPCENHSTQFTQTEDVAESLSVSC